MRTTLAVVISTLIFAIIGFAQKPEKESVGASVTPFTYQGKLTVGGTAINGSYDFMIRIYEQPEGGEWMEEKVAENIQVISGVFTIPIEIDPIFFQRIAKSYLDIWVRPAGEGEYTQLTPRQQISSTPYAMVADNSKEANSLSCSNCVTNGHIVSVPGSKVTGTVANAVTAQNAVNAVDLTTDQTVGENKTFTGNVTSGGVFSGNGSGLTDLPASSITGTINTTQLAPEPLPNNSQAKLLGMLRWDVLKPESTFAVGSNPQGVAFDGTHIWVANTGSNNVTKLRPSDGSVIGTYPVGNNPRGIAFDGTNIWVTNGNDGTITRLAPSFPEP